MNILRLSVEGLGRWALAHRQRACYAEFDPCQKPTIPVLERQRQEDPCSFVGQASEMNRWTPGSERDPVSKPMWGAIEEDACGFPLCTHALAHTCIYPMNSYRHTHRIATGMFSSFAWTLPHPLNSMYAPKLGPVWKVSCYLADLGVSNLNSSWYFQHVTVKVQDVNPLPPSKKVPVWNSDMCAHQK